MCPRKKCSACALWLNAHRNYRKKLPDDIGSKCRPLRRPPGTSTLKSRAPTERDVHTVP